MEIHKIKGYCGTSDFMKECSGLLQVLDPKYANGTEKNMQSAIKLDIDLSNFKAKNMEILLLIMIICILTVNQILF